MNDESIFAAALDRTDPAERAAYLDTACTSAQQRARVEGLLAALGRSDDFLEGPAAGPAESLGATRRIRPPTDDNEERSEPEEPDEPLTFLEPPIRAGSLGRIGHYDVLQVIGRGGFGIVFRAFDDVLQRVVAIKVLSPRMAATSPARKRFVREARGYAAIRHENVVQVYAIEADPLPYIVMEFVPGGTLEGLLSRTGPLPAADVARIGLQLARGLAAAHAIGLVHRDIKPANVLVEPGPDLRVKLTDFGLARAADDASLTQSGMIAGTPMFMAPEQALGAALDHRSDLFSLGSVLYTLCTGRPPFRAPTSLAVLKRVTEDDPRPIREIIPETPPALCTVIEGLHAKDPADRIPSATELADRLAQCLDGPAAPAPAPRPTRHLVRWLGLGVIALLLGVLLGGAYTAYQFTTTRPPAFDPPGPAPQPPAPQPSVPEAPAARAPHALINLLTSPDWEWSAPENLGTGVNGPGRESSPSLTSDELVMVFGRRDALWISRRASVNEPFGRAERLSDEINTQVREAAAISGDGLLLAVSSDRAGSSSFDIWVSERASRDEPFGAPVRLPAPVNSAGVETTPALSADGLTLLLATQRRGGVGLGDVVMYTRKTRGEPFGNETVFPAPVNSPAFDAPAWVSDDRRVLVRSRMEKAPFETRFHVRESADAAFGPPQPFDFRANAIDLGKLWLSPDGTRLYFHSRDLGGEGDLDLWVIRRVPKKR